MCLKSAKSRWSYREWLPAWIFLAVAFSLFVSTPSFAQYQLEFNFLNVDNGLSQNTVRAIFQDSRGFLWIGTDDGLSLFDGKLTESFPLRSASSSNQVTALQEDSTRRLWLGTANGMVALDLHRQQLLGEFFDENQESLGFISDIQLFKGELYVIGRNTIFGWKKDAGLFEKRPVKLEAGKPEKFVSVGDNSLFLVSNNNRLLRWIPEQTDAFLLQNHPNMTSNLMHLAAGAGSHLLALSDSNWVNVYDLTSNRVVVRHELPGRVTSLKTENDRFFWCAVDEFDVYRLSVADIFSPPEKITPGEFNRRFDLSSPISMETGQDGIIWIGTNGSGVAKLIPQEKLINLVNERAREGPTLINRSIRTLAFLDDERLVIGGYTGMEYLNLRSREVKTIQFRRVTPDVVPYSMHVDDVVPERIWIGSEGEGLYKLENLQSVPERMALFGNSSQDLIQSIVSISKDTLLLGTNLGLGLYSKSLNALSEYWPFETPKESITVIKKGENGFWCGTKSGRVFRLTTELKPENEIHLDSTGQTMVLSIWIRESDELWIGTNNGLFKVDRSGKSIRRLTTEEGLPNNVIYSIQPDNEGNLWLSSNMGISRLKTTDYSVQSYTLADGLQSLEFNRNAYAQSPKGIIAVAGVAGLNFFHPMQIAKSIQKSPVYVKEVRSSQKRFRFFATGMVEEIFQFEPNERDISIKLSSPIFLNPNSTAFYYRFVGSGESWTKVNSTEEVIFSRLPYGSYQLELIRSQAGIEEEAPRTTVHLVLHPPFYMSTWFLTTTAMLILVAGPVAYSIRVRKLKKEKQMQQRFSDNLMISLEDERRRIAGALHDSVGNQMLLVKRLVKRASQKPGNGHFAEIDALIDESIHEIRAISHNLHPHLLETIGLSKSIQALFDSFREVAPFTIYTRIENVDEYFSGEEPILFYRLVQETLNNVIRHADAQQIQVTLLKLQDYAEYSISDNGRGFDSNKILEASDSIGLADIRERARLISAQFEIHSGAGKGTAIIIRKFKSNAQTV